MLYARQSYDTQKPALQMLAPPPPLTTPDALRLLSDIVSPGGLLSMTIVGGSDEDLLQLLELLVLVFFAICVLIPLHVSSYLYIYLYICVLIPPCMHTMR